MNPIGLDIGGANLKASDQITSISQPFPLWKKPHQLAEAIRTLLNCYPDNASIAVTMTGELADCFETKAEGVEAILAAVEAAATGREIAIWQTGGEFVSVDDARYIPELVAASNWHALATWAGRMCPTGDSLLIDIGSTTTDIIPILNGLPNAIGFNDRTRLESRELLYLGVDRTPLAMLTGEVELGGMTIGLARENFATTLDLHLIFDEIAEDPQNIETANGRPATKTAATDRLCRMICADRNELSGEELLELARFLRRTETELVVKALKCAWRSESVPKCVLVSGTGEFLAREAIGSSEMNWTGVEVHSLANLLGPQRSKAACADALSQLASERLMEQEIIEIF